MTLSWRVQNIVVIGRVYFTLECFEFSSNFEFDRNMLSGTGARAALLSIGPLGTNFNEILIEMQNFSFTKIHLKILSVKWWPFCPGWDELSITHPVLQLSLPNSLKPGVEVRMKMQLEQCWHVMPDQGNAKALNSSPANHAQFASLTLGLFDRRVIVVTSVCLFPLSLLTP